MTSSASSGVSDDRAALPAGHLPVGLRRPIESGQDVFDVLQRGNHVQLVKLAVYCPFYTMPVAISE